MKKKGWFRWLPDGVTLGSKRMIEGKLEETAKGDGGEAGA